VEVARAGARRRASKQPGQGQKGKLSCLAASIRAKKACANQARIRCQSCCAQGHASRQGKQIAVGAQGGCKSWLANPFKVPPTHSKPPVIETVVRAQVFCMRAILPSALRLYRTAPRPQWLLQTAKSTVRHRCTMRAWHNCSVRRLGFLALR
jgi:hypothetical protein